MESYSILMSVYAKEKPEYFMECIRSMLAQTVPSDDFVLVCDGPLTKELDQVIELFTSQNPGLFQIIRLPENLGIGGAANQGLLHCKNDLVAKMDADDVSRSYRCEKQLKAFEENPGVDVVGGQLSEFMGAVSNTVAVRRVPLAHDEILRYARRRMPFNNQTVMYRRRAVQAVGGYSDLRRCEDYDLYVRMLRHGCRTMNLSDVLVDFRLNDDAYRRRGMLTNLEGFVRVRWRIYRSGFSSLADFLIPCCGQVFLSLIPNRLRDFVYKKFLR